jgi:hypothetical protein
MVHIQERYKKAHGEGGLSGSERKYLLGKRREILRLLDDVAWFANEWPEDQLRQVFTHETLQPLVTAILHPKTGIWPRNAAAWTKHVPNPDFEPRRKRLVTICRVLIEELWSVHHALAPEATRYIARMNTPRWELDGLRALLFGH